MIELFIIGFKNTDVCLKPKSGMKHPQKVLACAFSPTYTPGLVVAHHLRVYHGYSRVYTEQIVEMDNEIFLLKPYQQ